MKDKIATVATAGFASGITIDQYIFNSEHPSILAASIRLLGMDIKNCLRRKMLNAPPPKNAGIVSGFIELSHPRFLNIIKTIKCEA